MAKQKVTRKTTPTTKKKGTPAWVLGVVAVAAIALIAAGVWLAGRGTERTTTTSGQPAAQAAIPDEISVFDAASRRMEGAFILDVREPQEWEAGHIPDATLIPLAELENRVGELPTDQEIVVVCRSGNRSAQGRDILKEAGFNRVTSMAGGMNDWQAEGLPVVTGE